MLSLLSLLLLLSISGVVAQDIPVLTDANFEHDTQATTGSTTGRWLVLFHKGNDAPLKAKLTATLPNEESEMGESGQTLMDAFLQEGVVVGLMDYTSNPKTVERLKIPGAPHAIVLSKGKMYRTNNMEEIRDFAISEYEIVSTAETIPPLPSPLEALLKMDPNAKIAIAGIVGSLVLLVSVLVARNFTSSSGSTTPAKTTKKKN